MRIPSETSCFTRFYSSYHIYPHCTSKSGRRIRSGSRFSFTLPRAYQLQLHSFDVEPNLIRDPGNVLAVCRSGTPRQNRITKHFFKCLHISSCPGYLDRVPDRPLNLLVCSSKMSGNGWIQKLSNTTDNLHVPSRQKNGVSEIMIPLQMRRDSDI